MVEGSSQNREIDGQAISLRDIKVARQAVWESRSKIIADSEQALLPEENAIQNTALALLEATGPTLPDFVLVREQKAGRDFLMANAIRSGIKIYFLPKTKEFVKLWSAYGDFTPESDPDSDEFIGFDEVKQKGKQNFVPMVVVPNQSHHRYSAGMGEGPISTDHLRYVMEKVLEDTLQNSENPESNEVLNEYKKACDAYDVKKNEYDEAAGRMVQRRLLNLRDMVSAKFGERSLPKYVETKTWGQNDEKGFRVFLVKEGLLVNTPRKTSLIRRNTEVPDLSKTEEADLVEWFEHGAMFGDWLLDRVIIKGRNLNNILFHDVRD